MKRNVYSRRRGNQDVILKVKRCCLGIERRVDNSMSMGGDRNVVSQQRKKQRTLR